MKNCSFFLLFSLIIFGCGKDENLITEYQAGLQGTWLLTERGWSPGSGYNVDPVPPNPAQTVSFIDEKKFSSNLQGFAHFNFYVIVTDTSDVSRLHLYVEDPELVEHNTPAFNTFLMELNNDFLKIIPIGCIEGCHLGFTKNGAPNQ